jgi:DNA-binding NarL/FixJ family response regulator
MRTIVVVDDHEMVLNGTVATLQQLYPEANISTARTAEDAERQIDRLHPELVVADLSIPAKTGEAAQTETGIQLLKTLMERYPELNFVVQSAHVKSLVRLRPAISNHEGGFTIADKSLPMKDMLAKVN